MRLFDACTISGLFRNRNAGIGRVAWSEIHHGFALLAGVLLLLTLTGCGTKSAPLSDDAANHARSQVERGPVRVTVEVQPVRPRLSDSPTLTLTLDYEEGVTVEKPPFGESIGRFTVRDLREPLPKTDNGRVIVQQVYTLEPTEAGRLRIDPIAVTFADRRPQGDNAEQTVETDPLSIEVSSLLGDKTPTLADFRPPAAPVELPSSSSAWLWALGVLALVAVAAIAWRRRRKPFETGRAAKMKILTPEDLANLELDKLVASGLAASDVKQFYIELTAIVRRYIERTTGIRAPEQTTEEFLREISRTQTFEQEVRARLRDFLEMADLVKFATHRPSSEDVDESVRRARLFIATRRPVSPTDQESAPGEDLEVRQP